MKNNKTISKKQLFYSMKKIKFNKKYLISFMMIFLLFFILYFVKNNYYSNRISVEFKSEWATSTLEALFSEDQINEINQKIKCEDKKIFSCFFERYSDKEEDLFTKEQLARLKETKNQPCAFESESFFSRRTMEYVVGESCKEAKCVFCKPASDVFYVGRVTSEEYKDWHLFYLLLASNNPYNKRSLYRFLKKDNNLIFLSQYSDSVIEQYENIFSFNKYILQHNTIIIPDLDVPENIEYSEYGFSLEKAVEVDRNTLRTSKEKLKKSGIKIIEIKKNKYYGYIQSYNSGPVNTRELYYIFMPDGTTQPYRASFDFFVSTDVYGAGNFYGRKAKYKYRLSQAQYVDVNNPKSCENFEEENNLRCVIKDGKTDYSKIFWKTPFDYYIMFELVSSVDDFGNAKTVEKEDPHNMLWGKPVIYLYPTTTTDVSVKVAPAGGLTISDPEYGEGWQVQAKPNGEIYNYADGKNYPYLFWEGKSQNYDIGNQGALVEKENVKKFLQESLEKQGLVKKEIDEFIDFWLPRMQTRDYYQIYFMPNAEIDKLAPLTISPRPDSAIRVFMIYQTWDRKMETIPQDWVKPARKGFTVVEWGGALR